MTISVSNSNNETIVKLEGRLDTTTAPELEAKLAELIPSAAKLVLDFAGLAYISSAGLRVLLGAQKKMNASSAAMVLRGVNDMVMEVFEVTGFVDILTIE